MRKLYIPATAMLAFSYPLTTVILLQTGLPTGQINFFIKGILALLFLVALWGAFQERRKYEAHIICIYAMFLLYGFRLIYDILLLGIVPPNRDASYILLYFFGLSLLPMASLGLCFDRRDLPALHKWLFVVLVLSNLALFYYIMLGGELRTEDAFSGRFEVRAEDDASAILNPITVSLMGAIMSLFIIGRLAAFPSISLFSQILHLALFAVGMANLLAGGSRGPVIDLVVSLVFVVVAILYSVRKNADFRVNPRVALYLGAIATIMTLVVIYFGESLGVVERFQNMFEGQGVRVEEARDFIYAAAWQDFSESPLFGSGYLTMGGFALPHNSLLEVLVALGVIGGALYVWCAWTFLKGVLNAVLGAFGKYAFSIALAAVALVTLTLTSGTVSQSPEVWILVVLTMCMGNASAYDHLRVRRGAVRPRFDPRMTIARPPVRN